MRFLQALKYLFKRKRLDFSSLSFLIRIRNTLLYISLGLPSPYITRFLTKITNITIYYLLPQSTQKGEQKSPRKGY